MQPAYLAIRGKIDEFRDRWTPVSHKSTFLSTGQLTPEEFVLAGDYLVFKFPTWSWSAASSASKSVSYLPPNKQYLVTRGVPCHRRLNETFTGGEERLVRGGEGFGSSGDDEEGWLSTGGDIGKERLARTGDVKALGDKEEVEEAGGTAYDQGDNEEEDEEEEEIPDMEDDEDDDAIIREPERNKESSSFRTYTLYITYTPYYRTPRVYLSGYLSNSTPLPPKDMLEDIMGDYKDKTVTFEDFPFFDLSIKTASVHPCRHAAVMKLMLDRADAALKLRRSKTRTSGRASTGEAVREVEEVAADNKFKPDGTVPTKAGDEWEVLQHGSEEDEEPAIRVDQYIIVFLKFIASVTPGIEHDFTMGV